MPITDHSDSLQTRNLTVHDSLQLGDDAEIRLKEMAPPPTPDSGSLAVYAGSDGHSDGCLHRTASFTRLLACRRLQPVDVMMAKADFAGSPMNGALLERYGCLGLATRRKHRA